MHTDEQTGVGGGGWGFEMTGQYLLPGVWVGCSLS